MKIIDFTKKGTKLPVIPVGTDISTTLGGWIKSICVHDLDYSFGTILRDGELLIKFEKKGYTSGNFYLIKLSTIERLAKEQVMYNTNNENMNPTIKLQENGDVIISNTETTTTLSKVTVDEICRLVKEDVEKVKFEVGKWYHYMGGLYVWNDGNTTYGFNSQKRFYEHYSFSTSNGAVEATPETVQQYLRDEFIRLGWNEKMPFRYFYPWNNELSEEPWKVKGNVKFVFNELEKKLILKADFWTNKKTGFKTKNCEACVFHNGKFATIIKPETITRAEAEKQLGKVITD